METSASTFEHMFTSSAMIPSSSPHDHLQGIQLVEQLTKNASLIQEMVLDEILNRNSETEYLHGFMNGGRDKELFRKQVPIVDYDKVKPYIERIVNGENSKILSGKPIVELFTSSGTSGGQVKLIPSTEEEMDRKTFVFNILISVINKYVEGLEGGKSMNLYFIKPEITTPSGLPCRTVLTSVCKSQHFRELPSNLNPYTSPYAAIICSDIHQSMYTQLLCGLIRRDEVLRVDAIFASAFLRAIKFLEDHWQELCHDIRTGEFSDRVTDTSCREAVLGKILMGPNAELADAIESECKKHPWEGIVKRLWPKSKYIGVVLTGSMMQYVPLLEFYGGGLPLVSTPYASSECFFGINLRPLDKPCDVAYTLLPNMCYYEFMRVKDEEDGARGRDGYIIAGAPAEEVVPLVDVELGCYYELIVTTFTGLYRYRVGDILKVTGFYNAAPQFKFIRRRNVMLSIDTDKTTEEDLLKAISAAKPLLSQLSLLLSDFTSFPDTSSLPGHYVLFWELIPSSSSGTSKELAVLLDRKVLEECCAVVESYMDPIYRHCRSRDKSIGPLEIRVVSNGAFDALMDFFFSRGSSVNQYKTPRCVKSCDAITVLDEKVVGKFFSQKVPHWDSYKIEKKVV